jgi:xanthosine utilization system XapX-like protein
MTQTFPLDSAVPIFVAAHVGVLLAMLLAIFRPQFPALWVCTLSSLGYITYALFNLRTPAPHTFLWIGVVIGLLLLGLASARWSARLRIHAITVHPKIVLGAFLGMILVILVFAFWGMFGQMLGFVLGASLGGMSPEPGRRAGSPSSGPMALYGLIGPRGFQFILVLTMADVATQHLFFRVGLMAVPLVH